MKVTVASLPSTTVTSISLELPSISSTTLSSLTLMLSTRHHETLLNLWGEVQQRIYEDTDRLVNGGPINRKIVYFMEYLIDKASSDVGDSNNV
mmetsp:Transcript_33243/g.37178  ORF Transcript_33243/g.37178 Transcript_33243/m.37178 type:complete len:93 (-) Transcript_33243:4-282(-)